MNVGNIRRLFNMVGAEGFEPPTPCSQSRCASQTALCPDTNEDRMNIQFSPSVNLHFTNKVRHLQALPQPEVSDVSKLLTETPS